MPNRSIADSGSDHPDFAAVKRRAESLGVHHWATWDNTTVLWLVAEMESLRAELKYWKLRASGLDEDTAREVTSDV